MHSQQAFHGRPEGGPQGPHFGPQDGFPFGRMGGPGCNRGHFGRHGFGRGWGRRMGGRPVPVNIESTPDSFVLTLYAAGLRREVIQLTVQDDVLTISYPGSEAAEAAATGDDSTAGRFTRREFRDPAFERAFQLNGKVLTEGISARYADGVLTVTLPKNPATNQPAQRVAVG